MFEISSSVDIKKNIVTDASNSCVILRYFKSVECDNCDVY